MGKRRFISVEEGDFVSDVDVPPCEFKFSSDEESELKDYSFGRKLVIDQEDEITSCNGIAVTSDSGTQQHVGVNRHYSDVH